MKRVPLSKLLRLTFKLSRLAQPMAPRSWLQMSPFCSSCSKSTLWAACPVPRARRCRKFTGSAATSFNSEDSMNSKTSSTSIPSKEVFCNFSRRTKRSLRATALRSFFSKVRQMDSRSPRRSVISFHDEELRHLMKTCLNIFKYL